MDSDLRQQLQSALGALYTIERELGGGGMSRVFAAKEVALDRPVVLKVLPPEMAASVSIERFRREIRLAASLQHPHIVPLHAAGQAGELLYYSMPLVEGESLRAKLARERDLPVAEATRILRDVAEALAYAHDHGVVHRDIKPDNILVSGHHAVVTDFGVAKAVSEASTVSSLTSMGVALGTPAYMAPEQAAADPNVDHRADIYALGAVGYEMLCGRPPFFGLNPQQTLAAHMTQTPDATTKSRPSVPPALDALIMRCLEKRPADRPQRAEELATQLEAMATPSGGSQPTTATLAPATSPPGRKSRRSALFAGGAIAAAAAAYVVLRVLGIAGSRSLIAAGVMSDQQRVVLSDFENRASDTTLGPTLTEAFRVDLAQSRAVQLEDPAAVSDALARMQQPARALLTPTLAREVAQRDGLKAVVTGDISPVGTSYLITASVVSAADGKVLTAARETAKDATLLIPALDRLSNALREQIGESLKAIRADEPLADVTTGSLDALRNYTGAARLANAGDYEGALPLLEAATQADTGFAMAYRKLAAVLANTGRSREAVIEAATKAYAHRDRLPELERERTEAFYHGNVDFNAGKEIAAWRAVLSVRPNDDIALVDLGLKLGHDAQYAAAESLFARASTTDSASPTPTWDLLLLQAADGQYKAADSSLARLERFTGRSNEVVVAPVTLAASERKYLLADSLGRLALRQLPAHSGSRLYVLDLLTQISINRGLLAAAEQRARERMALAEELGRPGDYLTTAAMSFGDIDIRYRNRAAAALAIVAAALAKHPLASMPPADRPYAFLATFYVAAGRLDDARRTLDEFDRTVPEMARRQNIYREEALGDLAAAQGKVPDAIEHFQAYHTMDGESPNAGLFELAEVYRRSGQADSAIVYYTRTIDAPGPWRVYYDAWNLAASYQRLGELEERKGDRAAAIAAYEHLLDQWSAADPELQPIIKDTHARIARLSGEH